MPGRPAAQRHVLQGELTCPRCGNDALEAVFDGQETNFLCRSCRSCWHYNLGWMEPVPMAGCPDGAEEDERPRPAAPQG